MLFRSGLYANNEKIDEVNESDLSASQGGGGMLLLFTSNNSVYYSKSENDEGTNYNYYVYNLETKQKKLFKPELFDNDNVLLTVYDDDVYFKNSQGVYKNNLENNIINPSRLSGVFQFEVFGKDYYFDNIDNKRTSSGYGLFKNNLLLSKVVSSQHGKFVNTDKQSCGLSRSSFAYSTSPDMFCINSKGTIVRMDSPEGESGKHSILNKIDYFIDEYKLNLAALEAKGRIEKLSFAYNKDGLVDYVIAEINEGSSNIYFVPYMGKGEVGDPQLYLSNMSLFGVIRR